MAKFCRAFRPPCGANEPACGANEPLAAEASLCLDTDFTPDILCHNVVQLRHKSHFVIQLDRFQTKNTGWSLINEAVVLNKRMAKMCSLI